MLEQSLTETINKANEIRKRLNIRIDRRNFIKFDERRVNYKPREVTGLLEEHNYNIK